MAASRVQRWWLGVVVVLSLAGAVQGANAKPRAAGVRPRRPGAILYKLRQGAGPAARVAAAKVLERHQAVQDTRLGKMRVTEAKVRLRGRTEEDICAKLTASGAVDFAEPDYLVAPSLVPNDPGYGSQWFHAKIESPQAWDCVTGNGSVIAAVLDTGVQHTHPDLAGAMQMPGKNTVDGTSNTWPTHFHGTAVAGCIAAVGNNGKGVCGVSWSVGILPVKISNRSDGLAYISDMAEGIRWAADQGARIINLSFGGCRYQSIHTAAQYARGQGALLFMSAGNDSQDISGWPDFWSFVLVGATTSSDVRSSFSNYGTPIDVVAPGSSIYTTNLGSGYGWKSGTSFASPIAAGVGALMLSVNPSLSVGQLESRLFDSCDDLGAAGEDSFYGQGRVNAHEAVLAAAADMPPTLNDFTVVTEEDAPYSGTTAADACASGARTYSIKTDGTFGSAVITNAATGDFTYTPNVGSAGEMDSFVVEVDDGSATGQATVTVAITGAEGILPLPASTFSSSSSMFYWVPRTGAGQYWLTVGDSAGGTEYYSGDMGTGSSFAFGGLPQHGGAVQVRLYYEVSGSWLHDDFSYTAHDGVADMSSPAPGSELSGTEATFTWSAGTTKAAISSPAPGATLSGAEETFTWNNASGVSQYWLTIGSTPGGTEHFNGDMGSDTSYTFSALPVDGGAVQVRLYSNIGGSWQHSDHSYTAVDRDGDKAALTSPPPSSTLEGASVTFEWSEGTGVSQYWLTVGSSLGAQDYFSQDMGGSTSQAVSGLPQDGSGVYVRLYSKIGETWFESDSSYAAFDARAKVTSPSEAAPLPAASVGFEWSSGTGVGQYWLTAGSSVGGQDYFSQDMGSNTSGTASGLPTDGSPVCVRLYSKVGAEWLRVDYTFEAYSGKAEMTLPAGGSTLADTTTTFSWNSGSGVSQYWLTAGSSVGGQDYFSQDMGSSTSQEVSGLPVDGSTIHVRLYSLIGQTWLHNDYQYAALDGRAQVSTPAPGSTLGAAQITFEWSAGTGVSQYWLTAGSSVGGQDYFTQDMGASQSQEVSGLPADGGTVYVRLYSQIDGDWHHQDATFTAVDHRAGVTGPAWGSTLTSSQVTFTWSAGTGVTQYWLVAGDGVGQANYLSRDMGSAQSCTLSDLPSDGSTVCVRLYSKIGEDWPYADYTYKALSGDGPYWLTVGDAAGGTEHLSANAGGSTSYTVGGLPQDGRTLHVRLYVKIGQDWPYHDYTYTVAGGGG